MSRYVKRPGNYPRNSSPTAQQTIQLGKKEILLRTYETDQTIQLHFGGRTKWCVHVDLIKDPAAPDRMKSLGYLVKIRYDELCSLNHALERGGDTKLLMQITLQYITEHYPTVTHLSFNDLSTRTCDNQNDVNLAVMTVFYTGGTWYQKNFRATIAPQSAEDLEKIMDRYQDVKKTTPWAIMKDTIAIPAATEYVSEHALETLYNAAATWEEFFQPLYQKLNIAAFCMFVGEWMDRFIARYFNNLQGLTYWMPVASMNIPYRIRPFQEGGKPRRYTCKQSRRQDKDEK